MQHLVANGANRHFKCPAHCSLLHSILVNRYSHWQQYMVNVSTKIDHIHLQDFRIHQLHICCQNWPGLTWTPRPYRYTVLTLSRCLAWITRDKLNIKPMVGTCRKRTISAPELETSRNERWEQRLAKEIRKQQKIFYHLHVYVKSVRPCNSLCLFSNLFDVPLFLTIFLFCSRVPIAKFPVFPCSPKTPGWPSMMQKPC